MFNCAIYQNGVRVKDKLSKALKRKVKFLPFSEFTQLEGLIQKHILDLLVIAGKGSFTDELNLAKRVKKHPILSLAPLVLYHPRPVLNAVFAGFGFGADEFFFSQWDEGLFSAKLKMIISRSSRDLGVNPTTRLPGTSIIEREISRRINKRQKFAACYADLDNFKAYNDYYGYHYGDSLIKMTSEIIRDVVYRSTRDGFVGHIGGDDFVFIIPPEKVQPICNEILKIFDRMIIRGYKKEDVLRGYIVTKNRRGKKEKFPIMTLSIAVIVNQKRMFRHLGEISRMIADLKSYTKTLPGSNYFVERRKKY
ncbi:MAG: diguanylate cyclase [candidate division Zixibacteria bacterium]|nr:diguanylate cyclase [candidate division Zixibacteria bacterium]